MYITASNARGLQAGSLLANSTRRLKKHMQLHTFLTYTHSRYDVLYDAKLQSVKLLWQLNQAEYHQITHANVHQYY